MIDISKGRYWDLPWSLVSGCTPCSPGCEHCWALAMERRFHPLPAGTILTHPERLGIPMKRRKPTVYAVWNDLFHEAVPDAFIGKTLSTILGLPHHTFLLLTKRADRMADITTRFYREAQERGLKDHGHIWHGLTVCNQQEADEKIPVFLQVPGKKFLSIEPMLGPIDLMGRLLGGYCIEKCPLPINCSSCHPHQKLKYYNKLIDAVILGGETGPGARPLHPGWVRSVREQCAAAGVPFFFKQWGEYGPSPDAGLPDHLPSSAGYYFAAPHAPGKVWRFGRKKAGRLIDGRTHDELAWRITE